MEEKNHVYDCLIIGSGPAGYTAAIYTARADLKPVIFTGLQFGGQLTTTTDVENYPGFSEGIDGNMLMSQMEKQAVSFGAELCFKRIEAVEFSKKAGRPHTLTDDGGEKYSAKTVIIATGASARWLDIPGEEKYRGFGLSACATCDGFFFRGKTVAVAGGGDAALEEAGYLAKICRKVYLIVRRDAFRASKAMHDRVLANDKIKVLWNSKIIEFHGDKSVEGVTLEDTKTGAKKELKLDGVFVAIGHVPNTGIFKGQIELDEAGYIKTEGGTSMVNVPGVFAAGDVADPSYQQAVIAAGSGAKAAMDAEKYINDYFGGEGRTV